MATIEEEWGDWLRRKRKSAKLTQERLAELAGAICSPAYISTMERKADIGKDGKPNRPGEEIVDALALALGESPTEARLIAGYAPAAGTAEMRQQLDTARLSDPLLARVIELWPQLNSDSRIHMVGIAELFAGRLSSDPFDLDMRIRPSALRPPSASGEPDIDELLVRYAEDLEQLRHAIMNHHSGSAAARDWNTVKQQMIDAKRSELLGK